uniref:K Homology domain-containing protein n=1 Tax=Calcidiscus leptoporus TaxID=127549 RepID=A0A7S0J7X2_9EUKA|mmetsp:Transcript_42516/g.99617  ORF Transcript_42516/g.99617 Transcript_42516/m.99617 type:complete len:400 (+) Transcript_42516:67-1266(+)
MKRAIDGESEMVGMDAVPSSVDGDNMTLRMWLPNMHVGTIIGKGGANVKGIREESGCKVSIAEMAGASTERLVSITGGPLGINKAVELMISVLDEPLKDVAALADPAADTATSHTLKLCLSNNQVGGIIGKGGGVIKQIREDSGAMIKAETAAPQMAERVVTVSGAKAPVVSAISQIVAKLSTMPDDAPPPHQNKYQKTGMPGGGAPRGAPQYGMGAWHQPASNSPQGPPGAFGYGAAPQYGNGYPQQQQSPYGGPPPQQQGFPAGGGGAPGYPGGQGFPPQASYPQGGYAQQGYAGYGVESTSHGSYGAPPPSAWGGAPAVAGPGGAMEQLVPGQLVGRLIGRGGAGIKELRELSGAVIKVNSECEPGTDQRKVIVSGTPEQTSNALSMISQRLALGP